jgi:hypothetical protein
MANLLAAWLVRLVDRAAVGGAVHRRCHFWR